MDRIALRCFVDAPRPKKIDRDEESFSDSIVMVIDTETTTDQYQNLLFGSCGIWINGRQRHLILFYNPEMLTEEQVTVIREFAKGKGYLCMPLKTFIEAWFYPYAYDARARLVFFNAPFDISRLAIRATNSRKYKGGFSFALSESPYYPDIAIKSLDSKRSFIGFTRPSRKKKEKKTYHGCFIDLRTLLFALTNKAYSLKNALSELNCTSRKIKVETHGEITPEYITYNVNDVLATYELYLKALELYALYGLDKKLNRIYSPASLGKAYHDKMGVTPFFDKNPDFPREVIGHVMTTYYGGRTEVRIRKEPTRVTYLDFTSMYPTMYILLGMDKFLKAAKIESIDNTREIQQLNRGAYTTSSRQLTGS